MSRTVLLKKNNGLSELSGTAKVSKAANRRSAEVMEQGQSDNAGKTARLKAPDAMQAKPKNMSDRASDQLLVDRVLAGEKHAYDLLVVKYQHKLVKLIMRYVHDHAEAMDVAQEAFLKAYRALPKFRGDSAFYTWLYRIAINTAKNHIVAARRRPLAYSEDIDDPERYEWHAHLQETDSPEAQAMGSELQEILEKALTELPDDLRTAIMLRELDGLSYEEIAEAMDCPVGTVRSRIFRAREALDKHIRPDA